ncbi:MAG: hypothetical protein QM723_35125 [Myxococcaceae bacterium]
MKTAATLLGLVALLGCQSEPAPPEVVDFCQPTVKFGRDVGAYAGTPGVSKQVMQGIEVFPCAIESAPRVSATVRVVDALQREIPSTISLLEDYALPEWLLDVSQGGKLYAATVTFTPPAPGTYQGSIRWEPSLGVQQFELFTVEDRSIPFQHHVQVPGPCFDFDLMGGVALCQMGFQLWASTGAQFDSREFAIDGDRLWVVNDTELMVVQLGADGTTTVDASVALPSGYMAAAGGLLAEGGVALLIGATQLWEARRGTPGIELSQVANSPIVAFRGAQWAPGVGAILGQGQTFCYGGFQSGAPLSCEMKTIVGTDGALMWTTQGPELEAWRIDGGVLEQVALDGFDGFAQASAQSRSLQGAPFSVNGGDLVMPTLDVPPRLAGYGKVGFETALFQRTVNRHVYWQQANNSSDVEYVFR